MIRWISVEPLREIESGKIGRIPMLPLQRIWRPSLVPSPAIHTVRAMSERVKRPVAACLGCLLALMVVASLAYRGDSLQRLDAKILHRIASQRDSALGDVARLIAHLGDPVPQLVFLAGACLLALRLRRPERAIAAAVLVAGASLTTQLLKAALAHPRLQPVLGYYQVGETAFPSGHTTAMAAMAYAYLLVVPRSWRLATVAVGAVLAVAVGSSVVVLHRHYPSDVLGGLLVASAWFFAAVAALRAREGWDPPYSAASSVCQVGSSGRS
jgi:membrane-associated phospholipid phosphatase